jgi:hypothetical protein
MEWQVKAWQGLGAALCSQRRARQRGRAEKPLLTQTGWMLHRNKVAKGVDKFHKMKRPPSACGWSGRFAL